MVVRTAKVLHVLGNLRVVQGQLDEALDFHRRALALFRGTVGNNHHLTADACYSVAKHCIRLREYEDAT